MYARNCPAVSSRSSRLGPRRDTALLGPLWLLLFANPFYVHWAHKLDAIVAPLDTIPREEDVVL